MGSSNLDISKVLRDPNFLGLSTIEKRKFLLSKDKTGQPLALDFAGLPIPEQSKFIESLTGVGPLPDRPSVVPPIFEYTKRVGEGGLEFLKSQIPTSGETLGQTIAPFVPGLQEALQYTNFARTAKEKGPGAAISQGLESMIPFPVAKVAQQIGARQYPEAIGTGLTAGAELYGTAKLAGTSRAGRAANIEPAAITDTVGRAVQEGILNADKNLHAEVGRHAEHIANVVDDPARNPVPVIEAKPYVALLQEAWEKYVHTSSQIGIKPPAVFEQFVNEAMQSPRWTWSQAKQVRSALGEMASESKNPRIRAISAQVSIPLRAEMRAAAQKAGLAEDFDTYNKLHGQQMDIRKLIVSPVKKAI